jgi:hypothetical protein
MFDHLQVEDYYPPEDITETSISNISVKFFPNPASSFITIEFKNLQIENYELRIYRYDGCFIENKKLLNSETITLDISNYNKGIYYFGLFNLNTQDLIKGNFIKIKY